MVYGSVEREIFQLHERTIWQELSNQKKDKRLKN